jgi:hypothetical protein
MCQVMPITQFLDSSEFDPETNRVMAVAFEMACAALQLGDQSNLINEQIAKRIIELAKAGKLKNAATRLCPSGSSAAKCMSTPMRRIRSGCCARAASGHAAAAPPTSDMNSRRLIIGSPCRRGRSEPRYPEN